MEPEASKMNSIGVSALVTMVRPATALTRSEPLPLSGWRVN